MMWPLVHIVTFRYVPIPHQILFVNSVSVVWNTFLSYYTNRDSPSSPGAELGPRPNTEVVAASPTPVVTRQQHPR